MTIDYILAFWCAVGAIVCLLGIICAQLICIVAIKHERDDARESLRKVHTAGCRALERRNDARASASASVESSSYHPSDDRRRTIKHSSMATTEKHVHRAGDWGKVGEIDIHA